MMKKVGGYAIFSVSAFCALLLLAPLAAYADTVTLTSTGYGAISGSGAGASNVYPYDFTVTSSSGSVSNVPLMCLSFENDIEQGESWNATIAPISGTLYEEAAYIFSQIGTAGAADASWANWELLDSGDTLLSRTVAGLSKSDQTTIDNLLTDAAAYVANNPNSSIYSDYVLYLPADGSENPIADGTPQVLIGDAPTPEPSSLVLLASGLLASAIFLYFKRRNSMKKLSTEA